jgi:hypothetical protein
VPVAVHCLIAYGVQLTSAPVAIHSVAGCFFYGAFAAKVLAVHSRRLPGWVLPLAGGTLAIVLGVLWYTSALWYYHGLPQPNRRTWETRFQQASLKSPSPRTASLLRVTGESQRHAPFTSLSPWLLDRR